MIRALESTAHARLASRTMLKSGRVHLGRCPKLSQVKKACGNEDRAMVSGWERTMTRRTPKRPCCPARILGRRCQRS